LNLAYIQLRRKKPEATWHHVIPGGPVLPIVGMLAYTALGVALFHVSSLAIYCTLVWFLLGLINYYGYTKIQKREGHERDTVYEHTSRFQERSPYKVIIPIQNTEKLLEFGEIGCAVAKHEGGDLLAIHVREVPPTLPLRNGVERGDHRALDLMETIAAEKRLNIETRLLVARSIPEAILETVSIENGDVLIMGWDGVSNTKRFIFGRKVDIVLHRTKCDLVVVSLPNVRPMKKIFIPVPPDDNPNLRFTGKIATAIALWFGSEITVGMVVPPELSSRETHAYKKVMADQLCELKLKTGSEPRTIFIPGASIASSIIREMKNHDVVIFPAARGRISKIIGFGTIPERVAKHCDKTVMFAKGHRGIIQPFLNYLFNTWH
jgi:CIC family chloride channel protein